MALGMFVVRKSIKNTVSKNLRSLHCVSNFTSLCLSSVLSGFLAAPADSKLFTSRMLLIASQ